METHFTLNNDEAVDLKTHICKWKNKHKVAYNNYTWQHSPYPIFPVDALVPSLTIDLFLPFYSTKSFFFLFTPTPPSSPLDCMLWISFLPNVSVHLFFHTDSVTCIQALKSGLRHSCALCRWFVVTYCNPLKRQRAFSYKHTHTQMTAAQTFYFSRGC